MLQLKKLTPNAFKFYMHQSIEEYARNIYRAQEVESFAKALEVSEEEVIPWADEALHSPDHYMYRVKNEKNKTVGWIWYEVIDEGEAAFLVYITVDKPYRRKGLASELMKLFEAEVRSKHIARIVLYVFKANVPAVELYKKCGYVIEDEVSSYEATEPTRYKMVKDLAD